MTTVKIDNLSKSYKNKIALRNISFSISPGVITALVGVNGAGKSTLIKIIGGLTNPSSGAVLYDEKTHKNMPHGKIGVMPTPDWLPNRLTGKQFLRIQAAYLQEKFPKIDDILSRTNLTEVQNRKIISYSLGMRQRLCLAAILLGDRDVLILDEPSNGLDPEGNRWLWNTLKELAENGKTIMVSSHSLDQIETVANDLVILHKSKQLYTGRMQEFGTTSEKALVIPLSFEDFIQLAESKNWQYHLREDRQIEIHDVPVETIALSCLHANLALIGLTTEQETLETKYFNLIQEQENNASVANKN